MILTGIGSLWDWRNKMIYHHSNRQMTCFCRKAQWFRQRYYMLSLYADWSLMFTREKRLNLHTCDFLRSGYWIATVQPIPHKCLWGTRVTHPIFLQLILSLDCSDGRHFFQQHKEKYSSVLSSCACMYVKIVVIKWQLISIRLLLSSKILLHAFHKFELKPHQELCNGGSTSLERVVVAAYDVGRIQIYIYGVQYI
jgi:hypothetical protein